MRWKPLEQQPIGWNLVWCSRNRWPFITADVLRKRPSIKWGVERGKIPPGSPWGEVRNNDRHLTLEEKRRARKERTEQVSGEVVDDLKLRRAGFLILIDAVSKTQRPLKDWERQDADEFFWSHFD